MPLYICLLFNTVFSRFSQADVGGPAGNILSNARDMSKWLQFHLRAGEGPSGEQIVPSDVLRDTYDETMTSPQLLKTWNLVLPKYPAADILVAYDLAWLTSYYRG